MASDLSTLMINQTNPVNLYVAGMNVNNVSLPSTVNIQDSSTNKQALTLALENYADGTYNLSIYQKPWLTVIAGIGQQTITVPYNAFISFLGVVGTNGQNYGTFTSSTWTTPVKGYYKINYGFNKQYSIGTVESSGYIYLIVNGQNIGAFTSPVAGGQTTTAAGNYVLSNTFIAELNQSSNVVQIGYFTNMSGGSITLSCATLTAEFVAPVNN